MEKESIREMENTRQKRRKRINIKSLRKRGMGRKEDGESVKTEKKRSKESAKKRKNKNK